MQQEVTGNEIALLKVRPQAPLESNGEGLERAPWDEAAESAWSQGLLTLIDDARRGIEDVDQGRVVNADAVLARIERRLGSPATGRPSLAPGHARATDTPWDAAMSVSCRDRLEHLEQRSAAGAACGGFTRLVSELRHLVLPCLARFPRMGQGFLVGLRPTAAAKAMLTTLPTGSYARLRAHVHVDHWILYAWAGPGSTIQLLSVRDLADLAPPGARV